MTHDYTALLWDESRDISEFLGEIDDSDFDQASLCENWRVRDFMSHMLVGHTTPMPRMLGMLARYRFNVPRGSLELSREYGSEHSPDEIRSAWSEVVEDRVARGIGRVIPDKEGFTDHLIHHQDMRRPLGRERAISPDRLTAALDALPSIGGFLKSKQRMKGLTWTAEDVDWAHGEGPEIKGPAEALIMAAGGRTASLDELFGDGLETLKGRS